MVEIELQIETRSIDYIPLAERHGKGWELSAIWFAGSAQLVCLATGVVGIVGGLNLAWSSVAIILGSAFGTFFMALHSTQGPQLGLAQMIQSRPQFGRRGALLVWGVALVNYIGFNAFSQVLAGQVMQELVQVEPHLTLAVFTGASLIIAVFGYDAIPAVQRPISYLLILCMLVFSIGAIVLQVPFGELSRSSFRAVPFLTQFFAATAYQMSWAIYVSDYSRYLPRNVGVAASFLWTYFGAFLGGAWMMEVGAMVTVMNPHLEVAASVLKSGDTIVYGIGTI